MAFQTLAELEQDIEDAGGVAVSYAGQATSSVRSGESIYGLFEIMDEVQLLQEGIGGVVGEVPTVTIATGSLTGLAGGQAIIVDGTAWTIQEHKRIDDGALTRIVLGEA